MSLRRSWEDQASEYLSWARTPGVDGGFWDYNLPAFLELLPDRGDLTVDVGCGEGRLGRELMRRGHRVVGVELSPLLASSASTHAEAQLTIVGSLESLPLADHCADLVTASMVLMDVDELDSSMAEIARILTPGGRFCFSVLHPLNTAGAFSDRDDPESSFVLSEPYFSPRRRSLTVERNGQKITFSHQHRTLARYFASLEGSGFVVDRLTEPVIGQALTSADPNWARRARMPNALHVSAMLD